MTQKIEGKNNNWWIWVLIIVGGFFLICYISEQNRQRELEQTVRQASNDVNYCRSKAAEYGMQGDAIFHEMYHACMEAKGW